MKQADVQALKDFLEYNHQTVPNYMALEQIVNGIRAIKYKPSCAIRCMYNQFFQFRTLRELSESGHYSYCFYGINDLSFKANLSR